MTQKLTKLPEYICAIRSIQKSLWGILFSSQLAIACSKLPIETLEQGVKYVQS